MKNNQDIKNIITMLTNKYSNYELESHLIYHFILSNKIDFGKSSLVNKYISKFIIDEVLLNLLNKIHINDIRLLENYLELLIPKDDRKINGAYFTPIYIVDFIIKNLNPKTDALCLDPSCGSGAFLLGLLNYFHKKFNKNINNTLKENIFGIDLLSYNIERAKVLICLYGLQNNEIVIEDNLNLLVLDSLRIDWNKQKLPKKFDIVLGNPPYVKFQDLSDENRIYLINRYESIRFGSFNIYFAFFELGYSLLKNEGKLGYITPNNYFTSLAAEPLRMFFTRTQCLSKVIDFNHKKVFDAQTYTAISFLSKSKTPMIKYDRIDELQSPQNFLNKIKLSNVQTNTLKDKKWRLLKNADQDSIKIIETIGTPLGKLVDVSVGIATLKDELYFLDENLKDGEYYLKIIDDYKFKIEPQLVRSIYKISDFKNQEDCDRNTRKIIFPYETHSGKAHCLNEKIIKQNFPQTYKYFKHVKELLERRDKGKIEIEPFYAYGRTQGLVKNGKKIISPTFSKIPRFLIVNEVDSFFCNGYGIYFKENSNSHLAFIETNELSKVENIDVLQKVLNSIVMNYYVTKTSVSIAGGYPCYQKNFIEKFSIPSFSIQELDYLNQPLTKNQIDVFLQKKYGINIKM